MPMLVQVLHRALVFISFSLSLLDFGCSASMNLCVHITQSLTQGVAVLNRYLSENLQRRCNLWINISFSGTNVVWVKSTASTNSIGANEKWEESASKKNLPVCWCLYIVAVFVAFVKTHYYTVFYYRTFGFSFARCRAIGILKHTLRAHSTHTHTHMCYLLLCGGMGATNNEK